MEPKLAVPWHDQGRCRWNKAPHMKETKKCSQGSEEHEPPKGSPPDRTPHYTRRGHAVKGDALILLYIDESGSFDDPADHFVVGGVAVDERDARQLNRVIDSLAARHLDPHLRSLELHAQHIRAGKGPWGRVPTEIKTRLLSEVPRLLGRFSGTPGYALFAVARAPQAVPTADPFNASYRPRTSSPTASIDTIGQVTPAC